MSNLILYSCSEDSLTSNGSRPSWFPSEIYLDMFFCFFFSLCLTNTYTSSPNYFQFHQEPFDGGTVAYYGTFCVAAVLFHRSVFWLSAGGRGLKRGGRRCVCVCVCVCVCADMELLWWHSFGWLMRSCGRKERYTGKTATSRTLRKSLTDWYGFKENQTDLGLSVNDH